MSNIISLLGKVRIHPLFWLIIVLGLLTAQIKEFAILFLIVIIHEFGHGIMAAYFKWRIVKIELLPFGGVAETEEYGTKPVKEELMVILAGPLQHIWMGAVAFALHQMGIMDEEFYHFFMWNNGVIFFFNLLPIWPLDGGKILFTLFTMRQPFVKAHMQMIYVSCGLAIAGFVASAALGATSLIIVIMMIFIASSLYIEWKQHPFIFIRFLLERYYGKQDNLKKIKVIQSSKKEKLIDIFRQFMRRSKHQVVVETGERYDENELLFEYFSEKRVKDTIEEIYG